MIRMTSYRVARVLPCFVVCQSSQCFRREANVKRTVRKVSRELFWTLVALGAQVPILGAQATTILPQAHDGSTVWTGNSPLALDAAGIGAIVGEAGLGLFYGAQVGNAQLATGGGTSQVVFTAKLAGSGVTVEILNPDPPAANSPLSVSVTGNVITVRLATNAGGAVTSTAAQVAAAVNANPAASALVAATFGGTGTGVVQTLSATPLAPPETGPFAGSYQTTFANSASSPQDASVSYGGGAAIAASSLFLYVRGAGSVPAFYIYDLLAPAFSWNGLENLTLQGFWPSDGAIAELAIVGRTSTPTPVPEGSPLALLALGIAVLGWARGRARLRA
jgi:hypothetical protein